MDCLPDTGDCLVLRQTTTDAQWRCDTQEHAIMQVRMGMREVLRVR